MANITEAFVKQYEANVQMLSQQIGSRFDGKVDVKNLKGEITFLENYGSATAVKKTTRNPKSVPSAAKHDRRAIKSDTYDVINWIDEDDEFNMLIDPSSVYARAQAAALMRAKDQVIIDAATGTALGGKEGTTNKSLPAAQQIAVDYSKGGSPSNSGMTLAKMIEAKRILDSNEAIMPGEQLYMVISSQQLADLLTDVEQVSSADYVNVKALIDGTIQNFMGFEIVRSELLNLDTSTDYRTCFAYARSGLVFGSQYGIQARIDELPEQSHTVQVRSKGNFGAVRRDDSKVVSILCDESV